MLVLNGTPRSAKLRSPGLFWHLFILTTKDTKGTENPRALARYKNKRDFKNLLRLRRIFPGIFVFLVSLVVRKEKRCLKV